MKIYDIEETTLERIPHKLSPKETGWVHEDDLVDVQSCKEEEWKP